MAPVMCTLQAYPLSNDVMFPALKEALICPAMFPQPEPSYLQENELLSDSPPTSAVTIGF